MKNKNGSAIIWALISLMFCIIMITQIGKSALMYTKQKRNFLDTEQSYLTSVDTVNLFADEICKQTEIGTKILNNLLSENSLDFQNLELRSNCDSCRLNITMPYQNKIVIFSHTKKNTSESKIILNLILDENVSPTAWKIKNYEKES